MKLTRKHPESVAMDMTPMIDVVFQLIIFFMTVGQATMVEYEIMELPRMKGAVEPKENTLTINFTADNRLVIMGVTMALPQIENRVKKMVADNPGQTDKLTIVLRVDRSCTSTLVNQVMVMLQKEGIKKGRIGVKIPD